MTAVAANTNTAVAAAAGFRFGGRPLDVHPYGQGHINDTYLVHTIRGRYILQRINTHVFRHPTEVMDNIAAVTTHLKTRISAAGGNPRRETLAPISTHQGSFLLSIHPNQHEEPFCESVWRAFDYIADACSYETVQGDAHVRAAGQVVGNFLHLLDDYPAARLYETIPDFHNTPKRIQDLTAAVQRAPSGQDEQCRAEIDFALARADQVSRVTSGLAEGSIPLRTTHNDPKLDNVLVDAASGVGLCLVDLDTVMPGSALYDFGDCVRSLAAAREDERDLSLVNFDLHRFELFCAAFLGTASGVLTREEKRLLPYSAWLMTFECGVRFLTDHLNGDIYFKIDHPQHNLERARNQFHQVAQMEATAKHMETIVASLL